MTESCRNFNRKAFDQMNLVLKGLIIRKVYGNYFQYLKSSPQSFSLGTVVWSTYERHYISFRHCIVHCPCKNKMVNQSSCTLVFHRRISFLYYLIILPIVALLDLPTFSRHSTLHNIVHYSSFIPRILPSTLLLSTNDSTNMLRCKM